jgi:hypothetical protein
MTRKNTEGRSGSSKRLAVIDKCFQSPWTEFHGSVLLLKQLYKDLFLVRKKFRLIMTVFLLPSGETPMRRFEFSGSASNKFWEVEVKSETLLG